MAGTIVYYVVGPVHPRNAQLLAQEMPGWIFRIAYEPAIWWLADDVMRAIPFEKVALPGDALPAALWSGDVRAVVLSTVQPRQVPINLLRGAFERNIPAVTIEETNQIALNTGRINNYLLPADHVLVASPAERQGLLEAGVPERRVQVTGWPFYTGHLGPVPAGRRRAARRQFGLDPDRPVAALTLTALHDAGESPAVRRRQLAVAAAGLPPEYQLVVKPHPIEKMETLMPFVREWAPRARAVAGEVPIHDLLAAADVVLNRGVSQVCIEALLHAIPVVVLDTGAPTPFHGLVPETIVKDAADLPAALRALAAARDSMAVYAEFMRAHVPYPPPEARGRTARRLEEIAEGRLCDPERAAQWLDLALYQAWHGARQTAVDMLTPDRVGDCGRQAEALRRLLQVEAAREDLETLRAHVGPGFRSHVLRCLWIDQLAARHARPAGEDLAWMRDFPPAINTAWFVVHVGRWADALIRSGESEAAAAFARRLGEQFAHVRGIPDLVQEIALYQAGGLRRGRYLARQAARRARVLLRPVKRLLRGR